MTAYVIMHNMIVEDEREDEIFDQGFHYQGESVVPEHEGATMFEQLIQFHHEMRDWTIHNQLQDDLVEHMWTHLGNQ